MFSPSPSTRTYHWLASLDDATCKPTNRDIEPLIVVADDGGRLRGSPERAMPTGAKTQVLALKPLNKGVSCAFQWMTR